MAFKVTDDNFYLVENGENVGRINYSKDGNHIIVKHTIINDTHRGEGRGKQIVAGFLEKFPKDKYEFTSYCWFFSQETGVKLED